MYSLTVLSTIFSLGTLSYTLPTSQPRDGPCNALIETSPWHVSNLVILDALPTAPTGSSIRFRVHDTNYGLEFETSCGLTMPEGTGSRTEQAQGWHPCEDDRVRFLYRSDGSKLPDKVEKPGNIQIRGSYVDDCLGEFPYNSGAFYGNADTHVELTQTDSGEVWTQTSMEVPVTSQT